MPVPPVKEFLRPILEFLADGRTYNRAAIRSAVIGMLDISPEDRAVLTGSRGRPAASHKADWAITYLGQAGLLENPGWDQWRIAEDGKLHLAKSEGPITVKDLEAYESFLNFKSRSRSRSDTALNTKLSAEEVDTPDEQLTKAYQELTETLQGALLSRIKKLNPTRFEHLVLELMKKMGYGGHIVESAHHTGRSGDGGIDGIIDLDHLRLEKVYLQAKRYRDTLVGARDIREFVGALEVSNATKGVLMTSSSFTKDAIDYASRVSKSLSLIGGEEIVDLMIVFNVGVVIRQTYEIKEIDSGFFEED